MRFNLLKRSIISSRTFSNIIKSPYKCNELNSNLINMSIPKFTMFNFLNENIKENIAYIDGSTGQQWTYKEMFNQTHKFSHCLIDYGIKKGDCVGLMSPNHIHFFTSFQGLGLIGAISTPIVIIYIILIHSYSYSFLLSFYFINYSLCYYFINYNYRIHYILKLKLNIN